MRQAIRLTDSDDDPVPGVLASAHAHPDLLRRLHAVVGDAGLVLDQRAQAPYVRDARGHWHGRTPVVVRPLDTAQTAAVMAICHDTRTPVVAQGGHTSQGGGATPDGSGAQVVLSLLRMAAIRDVDPLNGYMTLEAGVLLQHAQAVALDAGQALALAPGAPAGSTLGGGLAANAGGAAATGCFNMRDLVLGLEVVMPDGRVWNGLRSQRRDASGYDLRHLFIGSQGTLGVITAATLKLCPRVAASMGCATGSDSGQALDDIAVADGFDNKLSPADTAPLAFELMMRIKQALDPNQLMNPGKLF